MWRLSEARVVFMWRKHQQNDEDLTLR